MPREKVHMPTHAQRGYLKVSDAADRAEISRTQPSRSGVVRVRQIWDGAVIPGYWFECMVGHGAAVVSSPSLRTHTACQA